MKRKNSDKYIGYGSYKTDIYNKSPGKRRRLKSNVLNEGAAGVRGLGQNTSRVTQGFGTAAAAALGFITMNVPGAMIGGAYANNYLAPVEEEDYMMPLVHAALGFPNKSKTPMAYNQGSFAAPYKVRKHVEDVYTGAGSFKVNEQFGQVTGSEAVYISANGFNLTSFAYTLALGMLRKLFRKIGKDIIDPQTRLTISDLSVAYRIYLTYDIDGGGVNNSYHDTAVGETLLSLAYSSGIVPQIENYIQGLTSYGILSKLELAVIDNVTTTSSPPVQFVIPRHLATLNLKNEKVHMHMSQTVTVQNRTKGAAEAVTNNVDVVDAQPLKGYLYSFKKNTPRTKMINTITPDGFTESIWSPFERTTFGGVQLVSSGTAGVDSSMKDPPSPHFFSNCSKASYVKLEPGAMKKFYVENNIYKYYAEAIRAATPFSGSAAFKKQNICDTMMLALEEVLNSGSANKISLQYEAENRTGAYFVTGPIPIMKKLYDQQEVNKLD